MAYQWFVLQADLEPTVGHEQAGRRPVLVVSAEALNDSYGIVSVISITSRKNNHPARLGEVLLPAGTAGLPSESFALCYQVRTLDKTCLERVYGELTDFTLRRQILRTLAECFDMPLSGSNGSQV